MTRIAFMIAAVLAASLGTPAQAEDVTVGSVEDFRALGARDAERRQRRWRLYEDHQYRHRARPPGRRRDGYFQPLRDP